MNRSSCHLASSLSLVCSCHSHILPSRRLILRDSRASTGGQIYCGPAVPSTWQLSCHIVAQA